MTASMPASQAEFPFLGEACALGAAVIWALALVAFKHTGRTVKPMHLNLYKNMVALVLLSITLPLLAWIYPGSGESFRTLAAIPPSHMAILALSGILGIAVADTLFFRALNLLGVGLVSIVDCVYTPSIFFFGSVLLGERITVWQTVGAGLIIAGVLISSRHEPPEGRTRWQITAGVICGISAMATMAFGIVYAKTVLNATPVFCATYIRLAAGSIVLLVLGLLMQDRREMFAIFKPSPIWRVALPGAILGSYISMTLWVAGFKHTDAAIAAVLNQTTVIFSIIFAGLLLNERLTGRKVLSIVLAFGGVALANLGQWVFNVLLGESTPAL